MKAITEVDEAGSVEYSIRRIRVVSTDCAVEGRGKEEHGEGDSTGRRFAEK